MVEQLIGFSVKNEDEVVRTLEELGANVVEMRMGDFARQDKPFYYRNRSGRFVENEAVTKKISKILKSFKAAGQFHMIIEKGIDINTDAGINIGVPAHHDLAIERLMLINEIYIKRGLGRSITFHLPMYILGGNQLLKHKTAMEGARSFFRKFDRAIKKTDFRSAITIENHTDPKVSASFLGNKISDFEYIFEGTASFALTLDTGHANLAEEFDVEKYFNLPIPVKNIHYQGNHGKITAVDFSDDMHLLPQKDTVKNHSFIIRQIKKFRPSVILEIADLHRYRGMTLANFVIDLKEELR